MEQHTPSSGYSLLHGKTAILYWAGFLTIAIAIAIGIEYLELQKTNDTLRSNEFFSRHLISYANLLLISSTLLYIAHIWFINRLVGWFASGFATLGAMGITVALFVHWIETHFIYRIQFVPFSGLYNVTALFSAMTVVLYLAIERTYRTRAAGAIVMPIVAATVLYQSFLLSGNEESRGLLAPALRSYWIHAYLLSDFIGHGALALAALLGVMYLFKDQAEQHHITEGFAIQFVPDLKDIDYLIFITTVLGLSAYTTGAILGITWSYKDSEEIWSWTSRKEGVFAVWFIYLVYFYGRHLRQWPRNRTVWLVILGFIVNIYSLAGLKHV